MVILGGLEIVAAGYIIHKHNRNKKDKQRLADEAAALEEQQYRIFPSDGRGRHSRSEHRRRRSHSRRRHSSDAKYRQESPRPPMPQARPPPQYNVAPAPIMKPIQRPNTYPQPLQQPNAPFQPQQKPVQPQPQQRPAQFQPQPQSQYPPDIKYGWTDEPARPQQPPQQDLNYPPTGWPAEWNSQAGSSRGRERRSDSPHVRFEHGRRPASVRSSSRSPPPSYRI